MSDINTRDMYNYVFEVADSEKVAKNTIQSQFVTEIQDGVHFLYKISPSRDLTRLNTDCIQNLGMI